MDRVNYLFYQLFLKIKYEKRRYFLYVLSFYVGLLLPTCCIANTRSVEQVIYYTTFKGMVRLFYMLYCHSSILIKMKTMNSL